MPRGRWRKSPACTAAAFVQPVFAQSSFFFFFFFFFFFLLLPRAAQGCTQVSLTNLYLTSESDLHPFENTLSATLGAELAAATCESVNEVVDGDGSTKWLHRNFGNGTWLTFRLSSSVPCVTKYEVTSANDFEGRDPASWIFSGSLDGEHWVVLDMPTNVEFTARHQTLSFPITFSHPFNWYRFEFLTVRDASSGGDMMQMADFSLYTGDCTDDFGQWTEFALREITANVHTVESDTSSFLSLQECQDRCASFNTSETYYRDYQCSAISFRPQWRVYGVDYSSECNLLQYWGEPQLGPSKYHSFYVRDLGHCHDGVQIADSCYRLSEDVEGSLEWAAASAACVAWGGYLATLDDSSEAAMLASTLRPQGDASRWIGLSTEGDCGGEYHWANNAPLDMTVSFLQFVSSSTEAAEAETDAHCVSVHENSNKHVGKKIEDRSCAEKLPFVCEKNMPSNIEDLNAFTCPGHSVCNGVGQYEVTPGNWANDTVCGCIDGFEATSDGVHCQCLAGTFLTQQAGTSGRLGKYCAPVRTCNKWGQYLVSAATPTSDVVCGCLANATSSCNPSA